MANLDFLIGTEHRPPYAMPPPPFVDEDIKRYQAWQRYVERNNAYRFRTTEYATITLLCVAHRCLGLRHAFRFVPDRHRPWIPGHDRDGSLGPGAVRVRCRDRADAT